MRSTGYNHEIHCRANVGSYRGVWKNTVDLILTSGFSVGDSVDVEDHEK